MIYLIYLGERTSQSLSIAATMNGRHVALIRKTFFGSLTVTSIMKDENFPRKHGAKNLLNSAYEGMIGGGQKRPVKSGIYGVIPT